METHETDYRPIEFEPRPGAWFNVLRLNVPIPRRFFSPRTSEHLRAGLHELRLAAASLLDEQLERVERLRPKPGEQASDE